MAVRDFEGHSLTTGNRAADLELSVVEDLDRSRSGNIAGDVYRRGRTAIGVAIIAGFDDPIVEDVVIDLQRVAG